MSAVDNIDARLKFLGKKRRRQRTADEQLVNEIRDAVEDARDSGVSMTKVSELLQIDRTQLYRTYVRD